MEHLVFVHAFEAHGGHVQAVPAEVFRVLVTVVLNYMAKGATVHVFVNGKQLFDGLFLSRLRLRFVLNELNDLDDVFALQHLAQTGFIDDFLLSCFRLVFEVLKNTGFLCLLVLDKIYIRESSRADRILTYCSILPLERYVVDLDGILDFLLNFFERAQATHLLVLLA